MHAHTLKKTQHVIFPICCRTVGISEDCLWYTEKKRGRNACVPQTLTKNPLNGQKKKLQKKLSPCEKGHCARQLPNVGVPKILPDRKFPILRRVLKSRSHPNAVTVILLTLIAFLHPSSLSFILSVCPSLSESSALYLQQGYAGLLLITCTPALGTVCPTGRWLLIARHVSLCCSVAGAMICGAKKHIAVKANVENNACSQWHACNSAIDCRSRKYLFVFYSVFIWH